MRRRRATAAALAAGGLALAGAAATAARAAEGGAPGAGAVHRRSTQVGDVRLAYVLGEPRREDGGGGDPVLLLHGFPMTSHAWRKVVPLLAAWGHAAVAPDLRGLGGSSRPAGGYDTRTVAEDVHRLMLGLGFPRYHVVGHDVGGWTAYALAAAHPEAVRTLAIVDVLIPGVGLEGMMDVSRPGSSWHFGFQMNPDLPEALVTGRERAYLGWFFSRAAVPDAVTEADLDLYAQAYARPGALRAAFSYYRALPEDARQNRESLARGKLPMPALAVGGGAYLGARVAEDVRAVAGDVREAVLEGCGHFVPEECPDRLAAELAGLFERADPGRPAATDPAAAVRERP